MSAVAPAIVASAERALAVQHVGQWRVFTLDDGAGTQLQVSDLGATWLSCRVPLREGGTREALLGRATPAEHVSQPGYLGSVVGRYANRIHRARFTLEGREVQLAANEGPNQLHGGPDGFHRRRWRVVHHDRTLLQLALHSPDGDQGFPGALDALVTYAIAGPGMVALHFEATVDRPCPVNLTSHAYFNLDGPEARSTIAQHRLAIRAQHVLSVDDALIPTGELLPVAGTPFDLRSPREIGPQRFDHCFALDEGSGPAATLWSADGRLRMDLHTDYPGLQFYGGHFLPGTLDRQGREYAAGAGLALEPQYWPDSPNRPEWAARHGVVLQPGQWRRRFMRLQFSAD